MSLVNLIEQARQLGAFEILISPETTPRARKKNHWIPLTSEQLTAQEAKALLVGVLDEDQRKVLYEKGEFTGFWALGAQKFYCTIQITPQGFVGGLSWIPEAMTQREFWGFPKWTDKSLARGAGGIHLIVAKNRLHLEAAASALVQEFNQNAEKAIHWQKAETFSYISSVRSVVTYGYRQSVSEFVDLLVLEDISQIQLALEQADRGRAVLLLLQANALTDAFSMLNEACEIKRFARHLQWAMTVKVLHGTEQAPSDVVPVFDLLAGVEPVRQMIREQRAGEIDEWMERPQSQEGELSVAGIEGQRTMNQALLQLVLKRKIDLRQGFEESPHPEKLDCLLRKVGF